MRQRRLGVVKRLLAVFGAVVMLLGIGVLGVHRDGAITTEIWINARPEVVWQVLTATSDYPAWNPMITQLKGELRTGNVIEFTNGMGSDSMVFHPTLLTVQPNHELRWKGYVWMPGLFDGEHRFILEGQGSRTRFVQSEKFTGIFAGKLTEAVLKDTVIHMQAMNLALKTRVESRAEQNWNRR